MKTTILIVLGLSTVGCSTVSKDVILTCGTSTVVVTPGSVEILEGGVAKINNDATNESVIIPPSVGCIISEVGQGSVQTELNNQTLPNTPQGTL